jgi:hypothetical protein
MTPKVHGKIGESTPKKAQQPVYVYPGSLMSGQTMVILTSTTFGSQFSKNWELFNQGPKEIALFKGK